MYKVNNQEKHVIEVEVSYAFHDQLSFFKETIKQIVGDKFLEPSLVEHQVDTYLFHKQIPCLSPQWGKHPKRFFRISERANSLEIQTKDYSLGNAKESQSVAEVIQHLSRRWYEDIEQLDSLNQFTNFNDVSQHLADVLWFKPIITVSKDRHFLVKDVKQGLSISYDVCEGIKTPHLEAEIIANEEGVAEAQRDLMLLIDLIWEKIDLKSTTSFAEIKLQSSPNAEWILSGAS